MTTVAERLGFDATTPLVIVTADQLGFSFAANEGVHAALEGAATSASLMVPAPWARHASAAHRGHDVGVSLTLNAEYDLYRYGPITQAPSLLDGEGCFPRTPADLWDHADVDEVRRECRAQLERAILWGFDVSHLSSYLDAAVLRPEFFDVLLELALDYRLALRLPSPDVEASAGFPFRRLAAEEGIVVPDRVEFTKGPSLVETVEQLDSGLTELVLRPAIDSREMRAVIDDADERIADWMILMNASAVGDALDRRGAKAVSWRDLRAVQRS